MKENSLSSELVSQSILCCGDSPRKSKGTVANVSRKPEPSGSQNSREKGKGEIGRARQSWKIDWSYSNLAFRISDLLIIMALINPHSEKTPTPNSIVLAITLQTPEFWKPTCKT